MLNFRILNYKKNCDKVPVYSRIHPTVQRTRLVPKSFGGAFFRMLARGGGKTAFTLFSHCNFPLRAKTLNPNGVRISVVALTNGRPAHMNTALANSTAQLSWLLISGVFEHPRRNRCFPIKNQVKNTFQCAFCPQKVALNHKNEFSLARSSSLQAPESILIGPVGVRATARSLKSLMCMGFETRLKGTPDGFLKCLLDKIF